MKYSEAPIIIWKNGSYWGKTSIGYIVKASDLEYIETEYDYTTINELITINKINIEILKYHDSRFYISGSYKINKYFFSIPAERSELDMEVINTDILRIQPDEFYIYEDWIYFTVNNGSSGLYRTSLDMIDVEKVFDYAVGISNYLVLKDSHSFLIFNDCVYYINASDDNKIYRYDMKAKTNKKVYDKSSLHLDIWKNSLLIINKNRKTVVYNGGKIIDFKNILDNSFAFFNGATIKKQFYETHITNNLFTKKILFEHYYWEELLDVYYVEEYCFLLSKYYHVNDTGEYAPVEEEEMNIYKLTWEDVNRLDDGPIEAEQVYSTEYISGFTVLPRTDYMLLDIRNSK